MTSYQKWCLLVFEVIIFLFFFINFPLWQLNSFEQNLLTNVMILLYNKTSRVQKCVLNLPCYWHLPSNYYLLLPVLFSWKIKQNVNLLITSWSWQALTLKLVFFFLLRRESCHYCICFNCCSLIVCFSVYIWLVLYTTNFVKFVFGKLVNIFCPTKGQTML